MLCRRHWMCDRHDVENHENELARSCSETHRRTCMAGDACVINNGDMDDDAHRQLDDERKRYSRFHVNAISFFQQHYERILRQTFTFTGKLNGISSPIRDLEWHLINQVNGARVDPCQPVIVVGASESFWTKIRRDSLCILQHRRQRYIYILADNVASDGDWKCIRRKRLRLRRSLAKRSLGMVRCEHNGQRLAYCERCASIIGGTHGPLKIEVSEEEVQNNSIFSLPDEGQLLRQRSRAISLSTNFSVRLSASPLRHRRTSDASRLELEVCTMSGSEFSTS